MGDSNVRNLALFKLALDSKLKACDLVRLIVRNISHGGGILSRAQIIRQKTKQPVQFEVTKKTRLALEDWIS